MASDDRGRVEAIFIAREASLPAHALGEVEIHAGRGLAGDRYDAGIGFYSRNGGPGRFVTLIAGETVDAIAGEGFPLTPGEHRRNVVTRGVDLLALQGREFTIGSVRLVGVRPCPPCSHLEEVTGRPGLRQVLLERGGLRADAIEGGTIRVGDAIVPGAAVVAGAEDGQAGLPIGG